MARGDPKFVRLPMRNAVGDAHTLNGCLADVDGSGFFIGGRDIQPFPDDDDPVAQRFVRTAIRDGRLEEASQEEHKAVREAADTMKDLHLRQLDDHEEHDRAGHQEAALQTMARKTTAKLDRLRNKTASDEDEEEAEESPEGNKAPRKATMGGAGKS